MLYDRPYMRESNPARELKPLAWLIGGLVVGFTLQFFIGRSYPNGPEVWFGLSPAGIESGRLWTLITYSFLHSTGNLLHLIFNALTILFIGRLLLPAVGPTRLFLTYGGGVLAAALFWLAVHFARNNELLIGASGGAFALFALFCCQFAHERMTFLLFFVIPVTVVPRYLLVVTAAITALFFLFTELFPDGAASSVAHSAHLAGMIAGVIAFRAMRSQPFEEEPKARQRVELPRWLQKRKASPVPQGQPKFKVNIPPRGNLKAEVDRILDKINTSGFASLTAEEKRTLDDARDLLGRKT